MSTSITVLQLSHNGLSGPLPESLCLGGVLTLLRVINNSLSSQMPSSLRNCKSLIGVRLDGNYFTGNISEAFGIYPDLTYIALSNNRFYGEVSPKWGQSPYLTALRISNNNISGTILLELGNATQLGELDLSSNHLTGEIPKELGALKTIQNSLIGDIQRQLGKLQHIEILDLSHNMLKGSITEAFRDLHGLRFVNISSNQLEGPIPDLKAFRHASFDALRDNNGLCGNATGLMPCVPSSRANHGLRSNTKLIILVVVPLFGGVLLLFILVASCFSPCRKSPTRKSELREGGQHGNVFSVLEFNGGILHDIIIEATEEFSSEYCIGSGGYGTVYKAALPTDQVIAVKKLHQSENNMLISNSKDFRSEIVALSEIRHRNIVQMYGLCSHLKHSFLVYEFVEREGA
ncbi:hypothetical protein GQ457_14G019340 [Hibiscus cannabinus]